VSGKGGEVFRALARRIPKFWTPCAWLCAEEEPELYVKSCERRSRES
jgi:hypothetical protein